MISHANCCLNVIPGLFPFHLGRPIYVPIIIFKQEACRPDSSAIYNWLSGNGKLTKSEIRSS